jgi:hypothetical protein
MSRPPTRRNKTARDKAPPDDPQAGLPYKIAPGGVLLMVRLTPRASRNGLDGIMTGADERPVLQLRIASPPVEGAANTAMIAFLAAALKLRKSEVRIVSGETSRVKRVALSGDGETLAARLQAWIAAHG